MVLGFALGAAALGVLVVLAVRSDVAAPHASPTLIALDIVVGLAFVAAPVAVQGPLAERVLVAGVGVAWLVGSVVPAGRPLHQAVLAVALIAFPAGRLRGLTSWLLVVLAVLVGLGVVSQLGVAMLFAAVAVLVTARRDRPAVRYPQGAAVGVAIALAVSWSAARLWRGTFDPTLALVGYDAVLLIVAATFPFAVRAVVRAREELAGEMLADPSLEGLEGLAAVLGPALGDPDLRVYRWHDARSSYVDGQGRRIATGDQALVPRQ